VLATVKHFAGNNQEWDRNHISSEIDERTLREIYFPAFERAVHEGGVSAVMTAYNLLNGTYCSHDAWLIRDVLKKEWAFTGIVMSDWGAVHDALGAVTGGMDLEMPAGMYMNREHLLAAARRAQD
jgi:beta-glucosidase